MSSSSLNTLFSHRNVDLVNEIDNDVVDRELEVDNVNGTMAGDNKTDQSCLIAVMGCTGAGKSSFIRLVTGARNVDVGHSLSSSECPRITSSTLIIRVANRCISDVRSSMLHLPA